MPLGVRIKIDNLRENNTNNFILLVVTFLIFYRLKIFKLKKIILSFSDQQENAGLLLLQRLTTIIKDEKIRRLISILKNPLLMHFFLNTAKYKKLDFFLKIGSGDPAWTAILTACLRSFFGILSPYLLRFLFFKQGKPRLLIYPSFLRQELLFLFSLEISFNLARLLYFYIAILIFKLLERWSKNERTSDSGFDGNSYGKFKRDGRC